MKNLSCCIFLMLFSLFYFFSTANGDELSELKHQMKELEEQNINLNEQLNKQNSMLKILLEKVEILESKDSAALHDSGRLKNKEAVISMPAEREINTIKERMYMPDLNIRGFADITFQDNENRDNGSSSSAAIGQLDMFMSSALSEKISFAGETVFEHGPDNELNIEVERLQLKYTLSDLINITIGRMHTALGFWNTEYHHSTWLHTTSFRPLIHNWEDEGGIIPNHFVGVFLSGKKEFERFDFEYDLGVANGRGENQRKVESVRDLNDFKAFNARVQIEPHRFPGLKMGLSTYIDKIPGDSSNIERRGEIDEFILGGHLIYVNNNVEFLAEVLNISHDDDVSGKDYDTFGFYLQGAYQFNKWKPFYRLDALDVDDDDPFYTEGNLDVIKHTLGIRWDPITWNSIKLEYNYNAQNEAKDTYGFTIQSAFMF